MEEEKAHQLYTQFQKVHTAAKSGLGLGYHGGSAIKSSHISQKGAAYTEDTYLSDKFVKSGRKESLNGKTVSTRNPSEVAATVAQKLRAAKREHTSKPINREKQENIDLSYGGSLTGKNLEHKTQKETYSSHKDFPSWDVKTSERRGELHGKDFIPKRGSPVYREKEVDFRREKHRESSRSKEYRYSSTHERPSSKHRVSESEYQKGRDTRASHLSQSNHDTNYSRKHTDRSHISKRGEIDWAAVVPGWKYMSAPERLKARTRFELKQAEAASDRRNKEDTGEDGASGDGRQWTRYVFNSDAPLEDKNETLLSTVENRDGEDSEEKLGGKDINTVTFQSSREEQKKRKLEDDHDSAIFGRKVGGRSENRARTKIGNDGEMTGGGHRTSVGGEDRARHREHHTNGNQLQNLLEEEEDEEDRPVVVEDVDSVGLAEEHVQPAPATQTAPSYVAESVVQRQATMSWRERAAQLRLRA